MTLAYCGDGATSEGDFHEACNLAGVMGVPLVLVIINNQYAISTPASKQTRAVASPTVLAATGSRAWSSTGTICSRCTKSPDRPCSARAPDRGRP